jgi:hypothetical protein
MIPKKARKVKRWKVMVDCHELIKRIFMRGGRKIALSFDLSQN